MERIPITRRRPGESGQTTALILIILAVFLLGVLGFATDYAQIWAHRQMAQSAADAACQAGAADLFLRNANSTGASGDYGLNFGWIGSDFDCSSSSTDPACKYAAINGYSANVHVAFPSTVDGAPPVGGFGTVTYPYIKVTVTDNMGLTFSRFLQSASTFPVKASATCGIAPVAVPIPMVVLNKTVSGSLSLNGNPIISIFGGPPRAIQVDSSSNTAIAVSGAPVVDVSQAGPSNSGADVGVFGNEPQLPAKNLTLGSGKWVTPAFPYGDPWILVAHPSAPATAGSVTNVGYGVNGCPDPAGCTEFSPGNYVGCQPNGNLASGGKGCLIVPAKYNFTFANRNRANNSTAFTKGTAIRPSTAGNGNANAGNFVYVATTSGTSGTAVPLWTGSQTRDATVTDGQVIWKNVGNPTATPNTAIFDPGLYYLDSVGLQLNSSSTVRPSTAAGDGSYGTTFYFSQGGAVLSVASNSGSSSPCTSVANPTGANPTGSPSNCITTYTIAGDAFSAPLQCPSGASNPNQLVSTVDGNILIGPCTGSWAALSTNGYQYRGFLFFGTHDSPASPSWGGGGQFLLSGFMYFHDTTYASTLTMQGHTGSVAYTLGNIVADNVSLGGNSTIKMILNPASSYQILRPTLLQ